MGVMTCPHCDEDIDKVYRTGDKKYPCGECNMVIAYDQVQQHLDELEVIDKRDNGEESNDTDNSDSNSGSDKEAPGLQRGSGQPMSDQGNNSPSTNQATSEREVIYQRGVDGLRQIKKERLKNWLAETDGVGAQTENRITMVFDRNESVHKNPHVLYNLLDDELSASASYINTIVQDVFAPEEENEDLLKSQGYTPWHRRPNMSGNVQTQGAQGGPMNATGANRFNPNQSGRQQQQQQSQNQPQQQQPQQQQQNQPDNSNDGISREEAEMMMREAVSQANDQGNQDVLLSGLSDATDEALKEMASNVGGLAGTVQRVIDEALVEYARKHPEKVIENMDLLNSILEADDDGGSSQGRQRNQPEENAKVDDALNSISGDQGGADNPSKNPPSSRNNNPMSSAPEPSHTVDQQTDMEHTEQTETHDVSDESTSSVDPDPDPDPDDPNPDIDDELLGESEFDPEYDTQNFTGVMDTPTDTVGDTDSDGVETTSEPDESADTQADTSSTETDGEDEFEAIFGDVAED